MIFSCTFIASIPIELLSSPTSYILLSLSLLLSYPLFLPLLFSPLTSSLLSSPPPLPLPLLFSLTSTSLSNLSPSLSFFKANYYRWRTSRPGLWDSRCREQRSFLYCYHFFYCSVLFYSAILYPTLMWFATSSSRLFASTSYAYSFGILLLSAILFSSHRR